MNGELGIAGLIPLFPFLGAFLWGMSAINRDKFFKEKTKKIVSIGAPLMVFLSFSIGVIYFITLLGMPKDARVINEVAFPWMKTALFSNNIGFTLDPLSIVMVMVVSGVGFLIHVYSTGYMSADPDFSKFFAYLNLFTGMMLTLVMADNILLMFVGWEGVGLCSYLLIGFWYEDLPKAKAGMKAFITNRIGDFAFIVGMFTMFWVVGQAGGGYSFDFSHINKSADLLAKQTVFGLPAIEFVALMFFIGATGKSAQIPLYVWLPDAMAGPTPVSALIHAATMVTAGVFMIGRMGWLFAQAPFTLTVVAIIGAITSLFAATIALTQYDIKKVLAYSTVSQLGYMFLAMGVGAFSAGIFHLMTHAFFKALLFLGSGSVIMGMHHDQDMRSMGGLLSRMKATGYTFLIGVLAIAGVFPFAGFFSKDEILFNAFIGSHSHLHEIAYVVYGIGIFTALLTAFYMFRQFFMTFTGTFRGSSSHPGEPPVVALAPFQIAKAEGWPDLHPFHAHGHDDHHHSHQEHHDHHDAHGHDDHDHDAHAHHHHGVDKLEDVHESPKNVTIPLIILAFLSAFAGFLNLPHAMGGGSWFHHWLEPIWPKGADHSHYHSLELGLAFLSLGIALTSILVAYIFYVKRKDLPGFFVRNFSTIHKVLFNKYFVDEIYQATVILPMVFLSHVVALFDKFVVDGIVNGVGFSVKLVSVWNGWVDKYIVDGAVNGVSDLVQWGGGKIRRIQTGYLFNYLYYAVGGVMVIAIIMIIL